MTDDPASLSKLHDLVVPEPVPWWPPAPGGWLVLGLLLAAAVFLAVRAIRHWQANAYRRAALRELASASDVPAVAGILRRTALAIAPRETIASLRGREWTDWLATRSPDPLPDEVRDSLAGSFYDPDRRSTDLSGLRDFADRWIRRHTRQC